jgi:NAD(P)-dependent dehydrogenase (short-subunit alcohol dehydrogenase family)
MFALEGRRALVTGAGQGVGAGIARALASQGAAVAVNDLHRDRADRTRSDLEAAGSRAAAVPFDVTDRSAVQDGVATAERELGGTVDVLVNNAGVPEGMDLRQFRQMDAGEWRRYVDLNLYGSLHCIEAVLEPMCGRGWGRIVQISSGAGRTGLASGVSLYGASKSGIEGFVRHLALEIAATGVTVNTIALGLMNNLQEDEASESIRALARRVPVGRLGSPADVGAAVVYVASDEASWLTGQTINLNGGSTTI